MSVLGILFIALGLCMFGFSYSSFKEGFVWCSVIFILAGLCLIVGSVINIISGVGYD